MQKINEWFYEDLEETTSTNDAVKNLLQELNAPCIVTAYLQTKGRGRLGRQWQSLKGNLFSSFAYEIELESLRHMVILSGVAVLKTIAGFLPQHQIEVKWPNDVLIEGKKISGILFEKAFDRFWVMGIGINVCHAPLLENADYEAACLSDFGVSVDRKVVLENLVKNFDDLKKLYDKEGFEIIRKTWLDKAYNRGKKVMIKQNEKVEEGFLEDLDQNGSLILKTKNGLKKIIVGDLLNG